MKTRKTIYLSLVILLITSFSIVHASDAALIRKAKETLQKDLHSVLKNAPFEDFIGTEKCCTLRLGFTVDDNNMVSNIVIEGQNKYLTRWAKIRLKQNPLMADPLLSGEDYSVNVIFKNRI